MPDPAIFRIAVSARDLLSYLYICYDRTLIANMRKVPFNDYPNELMMLLIRHHYVYNESLLQAVRTEETDKYIDHESIIGQKVLDKWLHPETGMWKISKDLNYTLAKNKQMVSLWEVRQLRRVQDHMTCWRRQRRSLLAAGGHISPRYYPGLPEDVAERIERNQFRISDLECYPCPPLLQQEERGMEVLGKVFEMPPISPEIPISECILFHDYA